MCLFSTLHGPRENGYMGDPSSPRMCLALIGRFMEVPSSHLDA